MNLRDFSSPLQVSTLCILSQRYAANDKVVVVEQTGTKNSLPQSRRGPAFSQHYTYNRDSLKTHLVTSKAPLNNFASGMILLILISMQVNRTVQDLQFNN